MALVTGLCVLVVAICSVHLAVSETDPQSELYLKLRKLFENKRVLEVANQVRRDLEEEKEKREHKDSLISELTRLLNTKEQRQEAVDRPWERREEMSDKLWEQREEEEKRPWEQRSEMTEEGSLYKRLLAFLQTRALDTSPWYKFKPSKDKYDQSCVLFQTDQKFKELRPWYCRYFLRYDIKITKPCKKFCIDWTSALKENNNCEFDDVDDTEHCERVVKDRTCSECSSMSDFCCGTCKRMCK